MFTPGGQWARCAAPWTLGGSASAERSSELEALRRCLDALPPSLGEAVWLRDLLAVPSKEVCKAMKLTPTNLWTRLHRARSALRFCMEKAMAPRKEDGA